MSATLICASLFAVFIATAYFYIKNAFSYWKHRGIPYKQPSFPFGNFSRTFLKKTSFAEDVEDMYNETSGPFIGIYAFLQPTLLVRDPTIIKDILIKDFHSFEHRGMAVDVNVDPMADNILLQQGEKWRHVRTQLSPAFSPGKMKATFDVIANCGKSLEIHVSNYADTDKTIEVRDIFVRFATNVIVSVAFGIDIDCILNEDEEFRKYGPRFFDANLKNMLRINIALLLPKLSMLLGLRFVDKDVGDFMIETVRQNLEYREKNNVSRKDFFQMLMQLRNSGKIQENNEDDDWTSKENPNKKSISLEEMAAHAHLFFIGGFESSSSTMSYLMYELAKHPQVQQKAYEEIVEVLTKHDGNLTYDSVADMKYVQQCLNETLRMHPPFAAARRRCTRDYKIPNTDVTIEKGTLLLFSTAGLQCDPKYYDEPRKFKPERYGEAQKSETNFVEMPNLTFGQGPRNCLGKPLGKLQSKFAVILLLRKFRFELADQHKNTDIKIHPLTSAQLPINGINLKVFKRQIN